MSWKRCISNLSGLKLGSDWFSLSCWIQLLSTFYIISTYGVGLTSFKTTGDCSLVVILEWDTPMCLAHVLFHPLIQFPVFLFHEKCFYPQFLFFFLLCCLSNSYSCLRDFLPSHTWRGKAVHTPKEKLDFQSHTITRMEPQIPGKLKKWD